MNQALMKTSITEWLYRLVGRAGELGPYLAIERRAGIKRLLAITVAIGAAIAIMYGESWAIERAPASEVACAFAKTADLKRALDNVPAALTGGSSAHAL
jgi:hypothetical protein